MISKNLFGKKEKKESIPCKRSFSDERKYKTLFPGERRSLAFLYGHQLFWILILVHDIFAQVPFPWYKAIIHTHANTHTRTHTHTHTHTHTYIYIYIRGAYNKFPDFFRMSKWYCRRLLNIQSVIAIHLMRWQTNFYDFWLKWKSTAEIGMHPTKAWLSQLVNFKNAIWHFRRTICNKIVF